MENDSDSIASTAVDYDTPTFNGSVPVGAVIATLFSCSFSIIGAMTIILTYVFFKEIRSPSRRLLVYLSISDIITSIGYMFGIIANYQSNTLACQIQGGIISFGQLSSFFWTASITCYLYLLIVKSNAQLAARCSKIFHAFSWGIPLAVALIAGCLGGLGYDSSKISVRWCWVYLENPHRIFWMLFTCKFWEFLAYITIPLICILVKVHIYKHSQRASKISIQSDTMQALVRIDRKLLFIPTVFILLRIWGTLRFCLYLSNSQAFFNTALITLHGVGNSLQGGANCVLYCLLTTKIRQKLIDAFLYVFKCVPCRERAERDPCDESCYGGKCLHCCPSCFTKAFQDVKSLDYYEKLGATSDESTSLVNN